MTKASNTGAGNDTLRGQKGWPSGRLPGQKTESWPTLFIILKGSLSTAEGPKLSGISQLGNF